LKLILVQKNNTNINLSQSTNRDMIKTTDDSTNKNTIQNDYMFKERNDNIGSNLNNKYITLNNNSENGSKIINQNTINRHQNNLYNNNNNNFNNSAKIQFENMHQYNDNEYKNKQNNINQEYLMNRFKQNEVSFSEMDDSKISESDKLSSYAPGERTKGILKNRKLYKF